MTDLSRSSRSFNKFTAALAVLPLLLIGTAASAQAVGPDEAVDVGPAPARQIGLTDTQKSAIYHAVLQQRVRGSAEIPVTVGALVPAVAELVDLPGQAAISDPLATDLKYAMVEDDVVVVDPIGMCVVDVLRRANP